MRRAFVGLLVLVGVAALAGCSSVDTVVAPDFASRGVKSVAVVHVVGAVQGEAAQNQIADFFAMEFMRKGYTVVERQQAMAVLKEQAGKLPSAVDEQAIFVGKLLNVNGVIIVNIPKFDQTMNLTAKMLDVKDGKMLWVASGSADTGQTAYTVVGAVAGAVGGSMLGGGTKEHILGAVAGGVVGGVVGNALAPQTAEKMKTLIGKMCRGLPGG